MEVILLEKMRNLGTLGEKVNVKPGFARIFLIPQGKAVYANKDNLLKFEERRAELEKKAAERMVQAQTKQQTINAMPLIVIAAKAGEEGKLFGSIGTRDIAEAIKKAGGDVEKSQVRLPAGPLRMLGQYEITVELEGDVTATVKINVTPES